MITFASITPTLFVGSNPRSQIDVSRLRAAGITAVLNLQTDADLDALSVDSAALSSHYSGHDIVVARLPIRDFDPDDVEQRLGNAVIVLDRLLDSGHRVYVHCTAGINRSPTVVIAYLTWYCGWSLDQAAAHVRERHRCEPYLQVIARAVPSATHRDKEGEASP
jgi:protein-tyrosine phosphatase